MRIHAIETGRVRSSRRRSKAAATVSGGSSSRSSRREWADWLPVYAWAIEHPEGVIVVDTGSARI